MNDPDFYDVDENPKRDSGAPDVRERGGCLNTFLALVIAGGVCDILIFLFITLSWESAPEAYTNMGFNSTRLWAILALGVLNLVSADGLLRWKRWGYRGLLIAFGGSIFVSAFSGIVTVMFFGAVMGLTMLGMLILVVQPVQHHLD